MADVSVLLVEDEAVVARDLELRLSDLGYEVAGWATSAREAFELLEDRRPDIVLMDIRIRGPVDGIEAAEQVRERFEVPVVFVTALADRETLTRAKMVQPFGFIVKPFTDRDLECTIEMAIFKHEMDHELRQREDRLESTNRELKEQRGFLNALFESAPVSVVVLDEEYRVRMINRHFVDSFNVAVPLGNEPRVGELLDCPVSKANPGQCGRIDECLSCQIHEPFMEALAGRPTHRRRCNFESQENGRVRQMTLLVSAAPLENQGAPMAIVILEDITELNGLRQLLKTEHSFAGIVGASPPMREIYEMIREISDVSVPVMILGESGTGKELVARAIHSEGARSNGSFVPVNCGALPDGLLESELFGHVKGAFTGAVRDRKGRFELADEGTIFLDEIGDLSPTMQVKLLRVLQEGAFERVGSERTVTVDARVVCATNKDLAKEVDRGRFRDDLFYRLCVVPITVPPLRNRLPDVPLIAQHILEKEAAAVGGRRVSLSPDVASAFINYSWPGNVRELQNALQYAFIKCKAEVIELSHLPPNLRTAVARQKIEVAPGKGRLTVDKVVDALRETGGNKSRAAKVLGVSRATLYRFIGDNPELRVDR